jgi:hypothetical protein
MVPPAGQAAPARTAEATAASPALAVLEASGCTPPPPAAAACPNPTNTGGKCAGWQPRLASPPIRAATKLNNGPSRTKQQALQQLDEQENEMAEQQFEEGMQQAQMDEQQANNP